MWRMSDERIAIAEYALDQPGAEVFGLKKARDLLDALKAEREYTDKLECAIRFCSGEGVEDVLDMIWEANRDS